jgi:hypothetical protein
MQELEHRMEQLPKERRECPYRKQSTTWCSLWICDEFISLWMNTDYRIVLLP